MLISGERRKRRGTSRSGENKEFKGGGLGARQAAEAPRGEAAEASRGGGAEAGQREEKVWWGGLGRRSSP